jgi:hypothetical protein
LINAAIELASSGDVICLEAGDYDMEASVFVTDKQNLTIKGIGASVMDTKLDYDRRGARGFDVTTDGFKIENMWLNDTGSNGVEIKADASVFRKLYVDWDDLCAGPDAWPNCGQTCDATRACGEFLICPGLVCDDASDNTGDACTVDEDCPNGACMGQGECISNVSAQGAYSVYPTKCSNTLVEYVEVENSLNVEVYENEAFDNVAGLLPLQEPNLDRLKNENILWHHNVAYCNNHENFARPNSTVANIPPGVGAMTFAGDGIEMHSNVYDSNVSTADLIVSNILLCQVAGEDCNSQDGYNPYPENIYIHDNQYFNNGTDPQGILGDIGLLIPAWNDGVSDVVWDGYINAGTGDPNICLDETARSSYTNLTQNACQDAASEAEFITCIIANNTQDPAGRDCMLDPIVIPPLP